MSIPRRPTLCLIAFCLVLWLPGFFSIPTSDRDEGRFAQASKQMLETGDFVNIRFGNEARNKKPVGIHWLQAPFAAAARAAGLATANPVWPYRVPSLLGALLAVLATDRLGRRLVGEVAAWWAAAMLASCALLIAETHFAKTDGALLGLTTLAMLLLGRAYLAPARFSKRAAAMFWVAMGAAVLIKGPVAPMVAGLAVIALVVADRRAGWLRALCAGWGVPLMLVMVLPWFVAIGISTEWRFFSDAVGGDIGGKLFGGAEQHWGPPLAYLVISPALLFPATIPVLASLRGVWAKRADRLTRFLIAWVVPSWILFEAVPTKLPHYVLPLLPALFLLGARWLCDPGRTISTNWARFAGGAGLVVAALMAVGAVALPVALGMGVAPGVPALLAALLLLGLGVEALWRGDWPRLGRMVLAMPVLSLAAMELLLPALRPVWITPRVVAALAAHYPEGRPEGSLAAIGFHEPSLVFLAGTDTVLLGYRDPAAGVRFLAEAPGRSLLVAGNQRNRFLQAAASMGVTPVPFAEIKGVNYAGGRKEDLTLYSR